MCQRTFAQNAPIYFGESFWDSKGLFSKSPLVGVWGDAPTFNAYTKNAAMPRFLICQNMLELRSKPPFLTFLIRKVSQRISHRLHQFILAKVFEIPKDFFQKVLWSRFVADAPTDNAIRKYGNAVLFLFCKIKTPLWISAEEFCLTLNYDLCKISFCSF